ACVASTGMVMPIIPGVTPCLRCIWDSPPPPGASPTCDTAGVLAPVASIVAALQAVEALKILTGRLDALSRKLVQIDVWTGQFDAFDWQAARDAGNCLCCKQRQFEYLNSRRTGRTAALCGRDAVQISAAPGATVDFARVADLIRPIAKSPPTF